MSNPHSPARVWCMARLNVITCNVRCSQIEATTNAASDPTNPDHWPDRAPVLLDFLGRQQPHLLGLQEPFAHQLRAIASALPHHATVGYGREGGSHGEYSALLYDTTRLELLEWDQLWLSDTPRLIGSTSWGNEIPRIVVWARLRSREDGAEFVMINTHLDHRSEAARVASASMITELRSLFPDLPCLVTGDFNTPAGDSTTFHTFTGTGPFTDTWDRAIRRTSPRWGSFTNYDEPIVDGDRIDWILVTDDVAVHDTGIMPMVRDGRHGSDHAAVQATVEVPAIS